MNLLAATCSLAVLMAPAVADQERDLRAPSHAGKLGLFQGNNFSGREHLIERQGTDVQAGGVIRSISVHPGERWEVCPQPRFQGECVVLDRSVPDTSVIQSELQVRSVRPLLTHN